MNRASLLGLDSYLARLVAALVRMNERRELEQLDAARKARAIDVEFRVLEEEPPRGLNLQLGPRAPPDADP